MKNCNLKSENGRSMIEMLGVLAIIGVLSVGGIAGYSKAMSKYRINKTIEQITLIAGNIRTFFAPQRSYEGLNNTVIKKAKLVPDEMWEYKDDGTFKQFTNVFGYAVSIHTGAYIPNNSDQHAFAIGLALGDNEEACIELLVQDWSNAYINAIYIYGGGPNSYYFKTPISMDLAVKYCSKTIAAQTSGSFAYGFPYVYFISDTSSNVDKYNFTKS